MQPVISKVASVTGSSPQLNQFDWTRKSGRTPSSRTGPNAGNNGKGKCAN